MNLTRHIVRKDLKRFWPTLLLPCAISAIRFGIGMRLLHTDDPDSAWFDRMAMGANVLWGIGIIVTFMLSAAIVQEDSVASPAFWQTRPVSGSRLLASKALGIFLMLGLLPVLVSIPWWLANGFGWTEICRAAAGTLAVQACVVLVAIPWAVVTDQFDRFLLWAFVAAVTFLTVVPTLASGPSIFSQKEISSAWAFPTAILAIGLLAAAGSLCTAINQFLSRRTWRSITLIVITGLSMAAVGRWWTWDPSALWSPRPAAPGEVAKDITISLRNAWVRQTTSGNGVAELGIVAKSVPSNYILTPFYSEQELRWADGSVSKEKEFDMWGSDASSQRNAYYFLRMAPEPGDREWAQYAMRHNLVPFARLNSGWNWNGEFLERFNLVLSSEMMGKLGTDKASYDGVFWFSLFHPEIIGESNILVGAALAKGSARSRIVSVVSDEKKQILWISLVETSPEFPWTDFLTKSELTAPQAQPVFCIVNRTRTYASNSSNSTWHRALISNVAIFLRRDSFQGPIHWSASTHTWIKELAGLNGATLAEVNFREEERFSLPLATDDFRSIADFSDSKIPSPRGTFTVTGAVTKAGSFNFFRGTTLTFALRIAGGVSDRADLSKVTLTHVAPDGLASTIEFNVQAWLENPTASESAVPVLQPGDVVAVPTLETGPPAQP
jgi:SLBB domain